MEKILETALSIKQYSKLVTSMTIKLNLLKTAGHKTAIEVRYVKQLCCFGRVDVRNKKVTLSWSRFDVSFFI